MERTESTVIQVAPSFENERIKEMELFGWTLQNRQELHERGNSHGRPALLPSLEGGRSYITTTSISKYVKLHFARSVVLPNLARIKAIEAEYFALPYPPIPSLTPQLIIMGILFLPTLPVIILVVLFKKKKAEAICRESLAKASELLKQLNGLL